MQANKKKNLNIRILAFVRKIDTAYDIFEKEVFDNVTFIEHDIINPIDSSIKVDYLVHTASVTASKMMVENPVETIWTTVQGTRNILEFARDNKLLGAVYLSSMEIYGICDCTSIKIKEDALGYIDLLNVRSSYPESKRLAECLCASYSKQYNIPIRIARLAQTFGAGIDKRENRVFAQFAKSVLSNQNIILHTKGEKANCYCYTSDAIVALFVLLNKGVNGDAYNIANSTTFCTIRELAETFIKNYPQTNSQIVIDCPKDLSEFGYAPTSILRLDTTKISSLGWEACVGLDEMISRLMESLEMEYK